MCLPLVDLVLQTKELAFGLVLGLEMNGVGCCRSPSERAFGLALAVVSECLEVLEVPRKPCGLRECEVRAVRSELALLNHWPVCLVVLVAPTNGLFWSWSRSCGLLQARAWLVGDRRSVRPGGRTRDGERDTRGCRSCRVRRATPSRRNESQLTMANREDRKSRGRLSRNE